MNKYLEFLLRLVKPTVRIIPYIITQYAWLGIIYLLYPLTFNAKYPDIKTSISPITHTTNWNLETDPLILAHLTDIHIKADWNQPVDNFKNARDKVVYNIKPDWVILTGDLCDNFPGGGFPRYSQQVTKELEIYRHETENFSRFNFFDMAGNHDEIGVWRFNDKGHLFMQGKNITKDEFLVSRKKVTHNDKNIYFIIVNPFEWPSAHLNFNFYPHSNKKLLNMIEKQYEGITKDDIVVVYSHFPLTFYDNSKSSKGRKFIDMIRKSDFPQYFISGHNHPPMPFIFHHEENLEIIGTDLIFHNRFVYTSIDNKNFTPYVITSPVPEKLITKHNPVDEQKSYVRIRAYTEKQPSIKITGAFEADMECRKANDGNGYVCNAPYDLKEGNHTIFFSGDFNSNLTFIVGTKTVTVTEAEPKDTHYMFHYWNLLILYIPIILMVLPIPMPKIVEETEDWICKKTDEGYFAWKRWLITILLFPLLFKQRVNKLALWLRIVVYLAVLWPCILPHTFLEFGGHPGFLWMWGAVSDWKNVYDIQAPIYCTNYILWVLYPCLIALVQSGVNNDLLGIFTWVDGYYAYYCITRNMDFTTYQLIMTAGFVLAKWSLGQVVLPVVWWSIALLYKVYKTFWPPKEPEYSLDSAELLSTPPI